MNAVASLRAEQADLSSPPAPVRPTRYWMVLVLTTALAAAYLAYCLPQRGWVPHDDGVLGESAMRVVRGQLPHRDFAEVYTGGLAFLDAAAFRVFGATTMTTRWVLFAFVVPAIAALFYILTRFVGPFTAGACTVVTVIWSFAVYTPAMPSWYNLVFAIFGTAAVLRYLEHPARGWLLAAGVCAGLSFDIKLPGVYLLAAILLFLIFEEQCTASTAEPDARFPAALAISLLFAVSVLFTTVRRVAGLAVLYHFFLPLTAVSALVLAHDPRRGKLGERLRAVLRLWGPVLAGFVLAIVPLAIAMRHALPQWFYGVFILPQKRFYTTTTHLPPSLWASLSAFPLVGALWAAVYRRSKISILTAGIFIESLIIALNKSLDTRAYMIGTYPIWTLATPVVVLGCAALWLRRDFVAALDVRRGAVVLTVLAACVLVEFPFSTFVYFCYVAPLVMCGVVAVLKLLPRLPHPAIVCAILGFLAWHGVFISGPTTIGTRHFKYYPQANVPLTLEHTGGILVPDADTPQYEAAISLLKARSAGEYTYCALDCPDVYFYSGLRNPTPILYDEFDQPSGRNERILAALKEHSVTAILLKPSWFIGTVHGELAQELAKRYPHKQVFRARFDPIVVRWK